MDQEEQPSLGNPAQIWILQGLAPEDATFSGGRGSPGQWWRGLEACVMGWDCEYQLCIYLAAAVTHTAEGREGTGYPCCFFTN